jgi:serine/threonine protein kinase
MAFDPYHAWLGIPAAEQPPNHYRLLGLAQFEADAAAIDNAADRQMAHVRTFQLGPNAADSQRILNELAAARLCLTRADRKAAYDRLLKQAAPADVDAEQHGAPAGGAAPTKPPTVAAAARIGPYELLECLASGNVGVTYKVRHAESGRVYSLKTLPPATAKHPEVRARFRREVDVLTQLNHDNLIRGVEAGEQDGVPYLVSEFVLGADLATIVAQQGPLAVDQAVEYLTQAARGLSQLHMAGVIHRNLKPHVLWVDLQGRLRITNLLLAKIRDDSMLGGGERLTTTGEQLGTIDYVAPEQACDPSSVDGRADLYSLGCTLYYLLTGRPPYQGKNVVEKLKAHMQAPIPSLRAARAEVPEDLERAYQRLLAKAPEARYASALDLLEELAPSGPAKVAVKASKASAPAAGSLAARARRGRWPAWAVWAAAVGAALIALGIIMGLLASMGQ